MTVLLKNWVISSIVNPQKILFKNSETELFKTSKIIKIDSVSSENGLSTFCQKKRNGRAH